MVDDDDDTNAQSKRQFNYLADDDNLVLSFVKQILLLDEMYKILNNMN